MRALSISVLALSAAVSSQLVVPLQKGPGAARSFAGPSIQPLKMDQSQRPIIDNTGPGPAMPPAEETEPHNEKSPAAGPAAGGTGEVMLSDVMGRDRSINIFAGFTRDFASVSQRLEDAATNSTVLAPLNSAIEKLPRKPWEDPKEYGALGANAYEGEEGYERAQRNIRRFVEAHIIPMSPWAEGEKVKPIGDDREVWWEEKDGKKLIQPGSIEVVSVASTVANGQVWILRGVRNY